MKPRQRAPACRPLRKISQCFSRSGVSPRGEGAPGAPSCTRGTRHPAPGTQEHSYERAQHPAPGTLHPGARPCTRGTQHPVPCTWDPAPGTLHPAPCTQEHGHARATPGTGFAERRGRVPGGRCATGWRCVASPRAIWCQCSDVKHGCRAPPGRRFDMVSPDPGEPGPGPSARPRHPRGFPGPAASRAWAHRPCAAE